MQTQRYANTSLEELVATALYFRVVLHSPHDRDACAAQLRAHAMYMNTTRGEQTSYVSGGLVDDQRLPVDQMHIEQLRGTISREVGMTSDVYRRRTLQMEGDERTYLESTVRYHDKWNSKLHSAPGYEPDNFNEGDKAARERVQLDLDRAALTVDNARVCLVLDGLEPRPDRPAKVDVPPAGQRVRIRRHAEEINARFPNECVWTNDVYMNEPPHSEREKLLSRFHAELSLKPNGKGKLAVFLVDGDPDSQHAAANGTCVNGLLVAPNGIVPLVPGSKVRFGCPELMVRNQTRTSATYLEPCQAVPSLQ